MPQLRFKNVWCCKSVPFVGCLWWIYIYLSCCSCESFIFPLISSDWSTDRLCNGPFCICYSDCGIVFTGPEILYRRYFFFRWWTCWNFVDGELKMYKPRQLLLWKKKINKQHSKVTIIFTHVILLKFLVTVLENSNYILLITWFFLPIITNNVCVSHIIKIYDITQ